MPDPDEVRKLVSPRCKAMVLINPNNPTGAVYPREVVEELVRIAEEKKIVLFSDEIYDRITLRRRQARPRGFALPRHAVRDVRRALEGVPSLRVSHGLGLFQRPQETATDYLACLELLASLRLCANVPGQWAVQTALGGVQSIYDLTAPSGRLGRQRRRADRRCRQSRYLELVTPEGALYAFVRARPDMLPGFDDPTFAMALLERQHVLVVPGSRSMSTTRITSG